MRKDIKILKQELIDRWIDAFDEFDQFKKNEIEVVSVKYADDSNAYNIQEYKNGNIKSSKRLFNQPRGGSYCEFGLNKNKLPVVLIIFKSNIVRWIGFYKWNKDAAEYIEFCYSTKIPSDVQKFIINEKIFQSISLKERGDFPIFSDLSTQDIIDRVLQHPYTFLDTKLYEYTDERISKSYGIAISPGIGEYSYEDVYSYDGFSLSKVERFIENWPPQIKYIKPSGKAIKELINDLSILLADVIIDALGKSKIDERVFNIQLNYHDVDNYWPYITITTEKEKESKANKNESILLFSVPIANAELENYRSGKLNEMFSEFNQYIQSREAWDTGRELLIKTSRILTKNRLNEIVSVSNDFIVFAVDWSMIPEENEIEDVLIQCGTNKSRVKELKKFKWF